MGINKTADKSKNAYLEEFYGQNILPLSMLENDRFIGGWPIEDLFFYQKKIPISKFEESFYKAIDYYNLFSSRLIMTDVNKFALQYCTDGAQGHILPPLNASSNEINIDEIMKMVVHVKTLPGEPLFAVTGIPLKDGIIGGISCSHVVADGISLMLFLFSVACILEGKSFPLPSPQRLFKGKPVNFDTIEKVLTPPLSELSDKIKNKVKYSSNMELYSTREYFSDDFLNGIKNRAKSENSDYTISNNQIITSYLLKKYHKTIMPDTDKIRLRIPVNLRDVHPDIDPFYIGYAVYNGFTEFTKDEINKMSLSQMAYRLKESIAKTRNKEHVKEIFYMSEYGMEMKADMLENYPPYDIDTDITSTNLTHFGDLESLGLSSDTGKILYSGVSSVKTSFVILKEKAGGIFAQITSRYPLI